MIRVSHLVKHYGSRVAVDDVSFSVGRGEVVGVLGPNGAGKSTTLRMLAGFLEPTRGTITIAGHDVVRDRHAARAALGYMPEAVPLYPEMRVAEYLRFRAELKGVPSARRARAVDDAMAQASVADVASTLIGRLSKGYRQRVGLADALVARPPILILDEPTAGLDPNQIRETRSLVRTLAAEHTILLSTHILAEVEATCSRVLLLHKGKLVTEGSLDVLRAARAPSAVAFVLRGSPATIDAVLRDVAPGSRFERDEGDDAGIVRGCLDVGSEATEARVSELTERAVAALVAAGVSVRAAVPRASSLEEVFAYLTESAPVGSAARSGTKADDTKGAS